ncbi:MAG: hypothetical protein KKG59_05485 [Nanoarchaeota archaeon]|nr:hypothetical protein [Nanoarchaeota archaeon]
MRRIKSHAKLKDFKKQRSDARDVLKLKLFQDVHEIKQLDRHVLEFKKAMLHDIKTHDAKHLKKHADEFEHEVHEELLRLIDLTKQDLKLYTKVFKSLQDFKKSMVKLGHEGGSYAKIADAEMRYANLIVHSMDQKLESLHKLFKRIRK